MTQNNDDVSQTALQHLGSRMRESRQAREISLTEMARRLGYTKSHLSSVENGLSRPSRELVERYERECLLQPGRLTSIIPDLPAARHQSSLSKEVRSPSSGLHTNGGPSSGIGIFVSHSSADNLWTREFVARLRQAGEDVFYDEHSLGYGTHMRIIEQEIQSRPIFITVVSPAAVGSPWVTM